MATRPIFESAQTSRRFLPTLQGPGFNWQGWLSAGLSLALLVVIIWKIKDFGFTNAFNALPASSIFWLAFAAYYLALPTSEWLIFRRLWGLPAAGFAALMRKLVSNEVLLGYSGEAMFYAWARRHARLVTSPFGVIKDVSVLSALAGNLVTLVMLIAAWPLIGVVAPHIYGQTLLLSLGFIMGMSVVILLFRRRVFSLPGPELRAIFAVHIIRLIITTLLSGVMWHAALPSVPLAWLILLATLQLLVTRLPLIPNKDLVFASLAIFLIGHDGAVATLIAMIAATILSTHLIVGTVLLAGDAIEATNG